MELFELALSTPLEHFYVYFITFFIFSYVLRFIFKKSPTHYVIFLSTILLLGCFNKDLFTNLPFEIIDISKIICNMTGGITGIIVECFWRKQRVGKTSKRRIV